MGIKASTGMDNIFGAIGWCNVLYRENVASDVQIRLNPIELPFRMWGGPKESCIKWACRLAPPGKYGWTIVRGGRVSHRLPPGLATLLVRFPNYLGQSSCAYFILSFRPLRWTNKHYNVRKGAPDHITFKPLTKGWQNRSCGRQLRSTRIKFRHKQSLATADDRGH